MFINCRFTKEVWKELLEVYGKHFGWEGETVVLALGRWMANRSLKSFNSLPAVVSWGIWIYKNRSIFEDKIVTPQLVASNSVAIANHFLTTQKPPRNRIPVQEVIDKTYPWGYFDGASQGDPTMCGVGVVLFLEEGHHFQDRWGIGEGTNKKVELLALYMLMLLAHDKGVQKMQIFGDSMIIIN